jgi:hypothetical protein
VIAADAARRHDLPLAQSPDGRGERNFVTRDGRRAGRDETQVRPAGRARDRSSGFSYSRVQSAHSANDFMLVFGRSYGSTSIKV